MAELTASSDLEFQPAAKTLFVIRSDTTPGRFLGNPGTRYYSSNAIMGSFRNPEHEARIIPAWAMDRRRNNTDPIPPLFRWSSNFLTQGNTLALEIPYTSQSRVIDDPDAPGIPGFYRTTMSPR